MVSIKGILIKVGGHSKSSKEFLNLKRVTIYTFDKLNTEYKNRN